MVDTYRTSQAYEEAGTGARAYRDEAVTGAKPYGGDAYRTQARGQTARRGGTGGGDMLEDAIPLVGILVGGALGYLAATALGGSSSGGQSQSQARGQSTGQGRQSSSVEHDETTDMIASNKVEGTTVYNRQGEKLGEVYNFMVGKRSGRVAYAVMSFGGFLGIGQKYHAVPWNALTYDTSKGGFVIDANRDRLMGAPHYGAGEDPFARPGYGREVQDYWASGLI